MSGWREGCEAAKAAKTDSASLPFARTASRDAESVRLFSECVCLAPFHCSKFVTGGTVTDETDSGLAVNALCCLPL